MGRVCTYRYMNHVFALQIATCVCIPVQSVQTLQRYLIRTKFNEYGQDVTYRYRPCVCFANSHLCLYTCTKFPDMQRALFKQNLINMGRVCTCRYQPCVCPANNHLCMYTCKKCPDIAKSPIQTKSDKHGQHLYRQVSTMCLPCK